MTKKNLQKTNKNLFLPDWLIQLLDLEGEKYGGPGVIASTAIMAFCNLPDDKKTEALKIFREKEIEKSYEELERPEQAVPVVALQIERKKRQMLEKMIEDFTNSSEIDSKTKALVLSKLKDTKAQFREQKKNIRRAKPSEAS